MSTSRRLARVGCALFVALLLGSCATRLPVPEVVDEISPLHTVAQQVLALHPHEPQLVAALDVAVLRAQDGVLARRLFAIGPLDDRGARRVVDRTAIAAFASSSPSPATSPATAAPTQQATILLRGRFGVLPTAVAMRSLRRVGTGRWQGDGVDVERRGTTELVIRLGVAANGALQPAPVLPATVSEAFATALRTPLIEDYASRAVPLAFVAALPGALSGGTAGDAVVGTALEWVVVMLHADNEEGATELESTIFFASEGAARAGLVLTRLASAMLLRAYADVELDRARVTMNREGQRVRVAGIVLTYSELARIVEGL